MNWRPFFQFVLWLYAISLLIDGVATVFDLGPFLNHWENALPILLAALILFMDLARRAGWGIALLTFSWVILFAGMFTYIGARSGAVFGRFSYTENLGPQLLEGFPLSVPSLWWIIIWPLYILGLNLVRKGKLHPFLLSISVGFCAALIDYSLEPVVTQVREYWLWDSDGVPVRNFFAWWGCVTFLSIGFRYIAGMHYAKWFPPSEAFFLPLALLISLLAIFGLSAWVHGLFLSGFLLTIFVLFLGLVLLRFGWPRWYTFRGWPIN